jgi:hypothetical protein
MQIIEVKDRKHAKEFIKTPIPIYKDYPNWIRPLDKDLEAVFDSNKNKYFRHGECNRWILKDDSGKSIGRIAAFYHKKTMTKGNDQPTGGIGFFECINDKMAAFTLFDHAKNWLEAKGMEAMDGPINFGERNEWWGCQIEGFDIEPNYRCNYHPPYYRDLFEAYGFQTYFEQLTFGRKIIGHISERMFEKSKRIAANPKYHFKTLDLKQLDKFTEYFHTIYNKAWSGHKGVPVLTMQQAKMVMKQMKPIIDPNVMYFGFYEEDPIAFFICIPDVNQIVKHLNGKLNLIGKLKFLYHKRRKTTNKIIGTVFGVVPEHRGKGVEGAIVIYSRGILFEKYNRYENLEMNWIGDFNPRMVHTVKQVGVSLYKKHITFRKLFDENKPFKPHPVLK